MVRLRLSQLRLYRPRQWGAVMIVFYSEQIHHSGATAAVIVSQLTELEAMRPFFFNRPLQGAAMAVTVFVRGVLQSLIGAWLVSRRPRALAAA